MGETRRQNLRVGFFVIILLAALGGTLYLIGGSSKIFDKRMALNASWKDVSGLKNGATVRLSGWDVGEVVSIQFSDVAERQLDVLLAINREYQDRIRQCTPEQEDPIDVNVTPKFSSEAKIETVGVLGDKYVSINMGDPGCAVIPDGGKIRSQEPIDILAYTTKATSILNKLDSIGRKVDIMLGTEEEVHKTRRSLANSFRNLEDVTMAIKEGDGLVHSLIYDKKFTRKVNRSLSKMESSLSDFKSSSDGLKDIIHEVKTGDGIAHELVYGEDGNKLLNDARNLISTIDSILNDLRTSDSVANQLLFDPDQKKWLNDLAETVTSLKAAADKLENGNGTAGLLIRDPSLYEDLRSLVGGAKRNKLLRAYIRKTVAEKDRVNASSWEKKE